MTYHSDHGFVKNRHHMDCAIASVNVTCLVMHVIFKFSGPPLLRGPLRSKGIRRAVATPLTLRTEKRFNAYQMITEFPSRKWKKRDLYHLIKKLTSQACLTAEEAVGGRARHARRITLLVLNS